MNEGYGHSCDGDQILIELYPEPIDITADGFAVKIAKLKCFVCGCVYLDKAITLLETSDTDFPEA